MRQLLRMESEWNWTGWEEKDLNGIKKAPKPRQEAPKLRQMTTEEIDFDYDLNENDGYYENK